MKIDDLIDFVKNAFAETDKAHDFQHSLRVYENAINIMNDYDGINEEIVILSALLHDVEDEKLFSGKGLLDQWFLDNPSEYESDIRQVISEVSFSKGMQASTIESMIVQDADRLDAIGAIGIARVFTYGGSIGRPIYSEVQPSSKSHFNEKLFKIVDLMNTERGKMIAKKRNEFMYLFIEMMDEEVNGKR